MQLVSDVLKKQKNTIFVMYNKEGSDKYFQKFISSNLDTASYAFISQSNIYVLVHELDKENIIFDNNNIVYKIYKNDEELDKLIEDIIADLKFPSKILLSYSTINDKSTDILSHGEYVYVTKLLKKAYDKYAKKIKFGSSEKIIYEIGSKKDESTLNRLKKLAQVTVNILEETMKNISNGMTEFQIQKLTQNITHGIMKDFMNTNDIVDYKFAWDNCPIVLCGENLAKGGHSLPSDKKIAKGDTLYFDFGIKAMYSDNQILNTDIQRMGYVLRENEVKAPYRVQRVFDTLVNSIEDGMDSMKPNVKGYEVDTIVRKNILKSGYPDYNHATGHPVGEEVHDIGAIISIKTSKRASLELVLNGVYTLEPRINIPNGGSIEEMIQVTKFGGVPLCEPQKELYLLKFVD